MAIRKTKANLALKTKERMVAVTIMTGALKVGLMPVVTEF